VYGSTARDLTIASAETSDARNDLLGASLHLTAVAHLEEAQRLIDGMAGSYRASLARRAIEALQQARAELVESSS